MGIEGSLLIHLHRQTQDKNTVTIKSTRPVRACQVFVHKTVPEALQLMPLLFSVCGTAQSCAAVRACEQAMALTVSEQTQWLREQRVRVETLREHLWRLMLEWPEFCGDSTDNKTMARMIALQKQYEQALCTTNNIFEPGVDVFRPDSNRLEGIIHEIKTLLKNRVFALEAGQWLSISEPGMLEQWAVTADTGAARFIGWLIKQQWQAIGACESMALPVLERLELIRAFEDVEFSRRPQWRGQCYETNCLTRVRSPLLECLKDIYGNGILVRFIARLTEIAQICESLGDFQQHGAEHVTGSAVDSQVARGIGQAEAARGLLVHQARVDNGRITAYQVLAPTEWNFHPRGVVSRALENLRGDLPTIEKQARMLINSIDPCVSYQLQITGECHA